MTETNVTAKRILQLVKSQDHKCAICGRLLTPETASLDHIVPLSGGGTHDLSNLWVVDHRINLAKGTMSVEEFLQMCREVTAHNAEGIRYPKTAGPIGTPPQTLF